MREKIKRLYRRVCVNPSRVHLERFLKEAAAMLPAGGFVLDAGAGDCCYQPLFSHAKYESADFCKDDRAYAEVTYVCDLTAIPVADERYDMVVCTQVLEHLPRPKVALRELHRVLKPNGLLVLTAPLFFQEHGSYDFFRYTQYGFRELLGSTGFDIQSMDWLEGYCATVSYQMETIVRYLPLNPKCYGGGLCGLLGSVIAILLKPLLFVLAAVFARLDLRHKHVSSGFCKNYAIIARKAAGEA